MDFTQSDAALISSLISAPSFAGLFVLLFFQVRKQEAAREAAYIKTVRRQQKHIDKMADLLRKCKMVPPEMIEDDEDAND